VSKLTPSDAARAALLEIHVFVGKLRDYYSETFFPIESGSKEAHTARGLRHLLGIVQQKIEDDMADIRAAGESGQSKKR